MRDSSDASPTCFASASSSAGRDDEAPRGDRRRRALRRGAERGDGRVDGEVDARRERAGGDERHHRDERLHEHRAVADHPRVRLALDQLGRGARRDERVESR